MDAVESLRLLEETEAEVLVSRSVWPRRYPGLICTSLLLVSVLAVGSLSFPERNFRTRAEAELLGLQETTTSDPTVATYFWDNTALVTADLKLRLITLWPSLLSRSSSYEQQWRSMEAMSLELQLPEIKRLIQMWEDTLLRQRQEQNYKAWLPRYEDWLHLIWWQRDHHCGQQLVDVHFTGGLVNLGRKLAVRSPAHCQQLCTLDQKCTVWTWVKFTCYFKAHIPHVSANESFQAATVSGPACDKGQVPVHNWTTDPEWSTDLQASFDLPPPKPLAKHVRRGSLFCFQVMMPYSYEMELVIYQYQTKTGVFGCDAATVYTNQPLKLAEGLQVSLISTTMQAFKGGLWLTMVNTEIFMKVWRKVIEEGTYAQYEWTVKADPDSVFIPSRLVRDLHSRNLSEEGEADNGMLLYNCKGGLHGPIEVLSRNAVNSLATNSIKCYAESKNIRLGVHWQCHTPVTDHVRTMQEACGWGEDVFLHRCLQHASVTMIEASSIMRERACKGFGFAWHDCTDSSVSTFHPFKDVTAWRDCYDRANQSHTL